MKKFHLISASLISTITCACLLFSAFPWAPISALADDTLAYFQSPPGALWGQLFLDRAAAYSLHETPDGYIMAGNQYSDAWPYQYAALVKTDLNGNEVFTSTFQAEDKPNGARSIIPVTDGYVFTGEKQAYYNEDGHEYEMPGIWLVKTDTSGTKTWESQFGDPFDDYGNAVIEYDSGYLIGAWQGIDTIGGGNGWMLHTDAAGTLDWDILPDLADETTWWLNREIHDVAEAASGYILATDRGIKKISAANELEWSYGTDAWYSVKTAADGGYIATGQIVNHGVTGPLSCDILLTKLNSSGTVEWEQTFGQDAPSLVPPDLNEVGRAVVQTADGGYALTGYTNSMGNGGYDVYVIKTDPAGSMEWDVALGGSGNDYGYGIVNTPDGELAVSGSATYEGESHMWLIKLKSDIIPPVPAFSYTPDSPVFVDTPVTFDASATTDTDGSIVSYTWDFGDGTTGTGVITDHTYSANGTFQVTLTVQDDDGVVRTSEPQEVTIIPFTLQWEKEYGDYGNYYGFDIVKAWDTGYIVTGYTGTSSENIQLLLFKIDENGAPVWEKTIFTSPGYDGGAALSRAFGGGYIVAGLNTSAGTATDMWLIKADNSGNTEWQQTYGGAGYDEATSVISLSGDGYVMAGFSRSWLSGDGIQEPVILKTDTSGNEIWHQTYPCGYLGSFEQVISTADGGYIATGYWQNESTQPKQYIVIKTDSLGNEEWRISPEDQPYNTCAGYWIRQTDDGGFLTGGHMSSNACSIKLDADGVEEWRTVSNTAWDSYSYAATTASDAGLIWTGMANPNSSADDDLYIVNMDDEGNTEWHLIMGDTDYYETGRKIIRTLDGSYVILANRTRMGTYYGNAWIVKIGPNQPPVAAFTWLPEEPESNLETTFDGSSSSDPDGTIVSYLWDFDDGQTGTGMTAYHTYDYPGDYDVTLKVIDEDGGQNTRTQTVTVAAGLTADFFGIPVYGEAPLLVNFSDNTWGGTEPYTSYEWDLDGDSVTDSTAVNPSRTYSEPGTYTVSLTVTDSESRTDTETRPAYIRVSGVTTSTPGVTIDDSGVTGCPACEPGTYDASGAPDDIDWATARGFYITASGTDGTHVFRITFSDPIDIDFTLYKLPDWTEIPFTFVDEYTIDVELTITGGVLDPPFVIADDLPTFSLTITVTGNGITEPEEGITWHQQFISVPLNATPDSGWEFSHWSGDTGTIYDSAIATTTIYLDNNYAITANFVESAVQPGDADGNGIVNVADITKIARIILELDTVTTGADADGNAVVNVMDITRVVQIILGIYTPGP